MNIYDFVNEIVEKKWFKKLLNSHLVKMTI